MLKVALRPRWLAMLFLVLLVVTVFVVLSSWQLSRSVDSAVVVSDEVEEIFLLEDVLLPQQAMLSDDSYKLVALRGTYDLQKKVIIDNRLQGEEKGYWVVYPFVLSGQQNLLGEDMFIPVARGWFSDFALANSFMPLEGEIEIVGRLSPTESPQLTKNLVSNVFTTLSVAQLINIWDVPSYSGFVILVSENLVSVEENGAGLETIKQMPATSGQQINWLNIFYAIEWVFFAGFALFLWWRLVADAYGRETEQLLSDKGGGM